MGVKKFTADDVEWTDENKEAYSWCINHGIKIGAIAAQPGYDVGSWKIRIVANNKEMISPGDYSRTEIYPKIFELYSNSDDSQSMDSETDKLDEIDTSLNMVS